MRHSDSKKLKTPPIHLRSNKVKFCSRSILIFLAGVIFLTPAVFGAENSGSEDLRMGDKAFENGDYDSAVRFFKKAQVLLGSPLWEQCALKLGKSYLKQGDIISASEMLTRLKKRNPQFPTGVLPGLILAAEGNFSEAVKVFKKVASQNGPERLEALYQQGLACLNTGAYADALKAFEELDNSPVPEISRKGRYARIYTLIHSGDYKKADEVLDKTASSPEREHLNMFNLVKRGDLAGFKVLWSKAREQSGDPRPEKLLYEICRTAADLAEQKQNADFAALCLNDSFKFAPGNAERKDVMHQLFNLQSRSNIDGARDTVNRYCSAFPEASDKALLRLQCGRLFAANNRYKEAVEIFKEVIKDADNLLDERRSAAFDASGAAEKGNLIETAKEMYLYLINRSTTPEVKQMSEFRFGEFFVRQKDYASAEKYFNRVILQNGSMAEEARYRLLAVLMDTRQYARAKQTAEKLLEAKTPEYANYGRYRLAELTELEGNLALARKLYLEYLNKAPASTLASAAAFSAAQLAEKSGDLTIAAAEYLDFVRKYPGDINAAPSLFLALRADCLSGGKQIAEKCLELMTKSYSQTKEYNASLLQFADYFFNHGNYSRALELLKKKNKLNDRAAAFILLESRVRQAAGNAASALQLARELLEKYPDAPEAVEANFLCGNILADLGETSLALTHFKKAEKQRVSGIFAEIISGRIADCSLSLYTGSDFDRHLVEDALKRYLKLAEEAKLPAVKLQSICKAGNCYARMGNHRKAVENYEKTLYFAALLKNNNFQPDPIWCARAAYGGARAAFKGRKPEGLVRALRLIRLYEKLELPGTGEDFGTLRKQLHEAYNLLKRKGK